MSETDQLVAHANERARRQEPRNPGARPARRVTVVTCMDARIDAFAIFGLQEGDAQVIRNAGGAVTDDVIRSLAISQRLLGTEEVIVMHHRDCGMQTFTNESFAAELEAETGMRPPWAVECFTDAEVEVRQCLARLRSSPFLAHKESLRGFIYDVATGMVEEVDAS